MTKLVRLDGSAAASPWVDSAVVFGMFVGTFVLAFWIYDHMPSESVAIALKVIPYAVIFAFVVWRRYLGLPILPHRQPCARVLAPPLLWVLAVGMQLTRRFGLAPLTRTFQ